MSKLELESILGSSTNKISQIAFAQDCLLYIAGSTIIFYNPVVDEQISFLKHSSPEITCISVSSSEEFLAVSSIDRPLASLSNKNELHPISNNPSSEYMESSNYQSRNKKSQSSISLYKLGEVGLEEPELIRTFKGHKYPIDHLLFSPDGKYLVSLSNRDGSMFVWNCTSG